MKRRLTWGILDTADDVDGAREKLARVIDPERLVVQDATRDASAPGTAASLLSTFLQVFRRDPSAGVVACLRADPILDSPDELRRVIERASAAAEGVDNRLVLVGAASVAPKTASWLLPIAENEDSTWATVLVEPNEALMLAAPFRFASLVVGTTSSFLRLYEIAHPGLLKAMLPGRAFADRTSHRTDMRVDPDLLRRGSAAIKMLIAA